MNRSITPPEMRAVREAQTRETKKLLREALADSERAQLRAARGYAIIRGRQVRGESE
jgi:hypothetical protein